jgi:hypothetical protein
MIIIVIIMIISIFIIIIIIIIIIRFEMDEADLRVYIERFTGLTAVSVGDLTDKRYI